MEKGALIHRRVRAAGVFVGAEGENLGEVDMKAVRIRVMNLREGGGLGVGRDRQAAIPVFIEVKQQLFLLKKFLKGTAGPYPHSDGRELSCSRRTKRGRKRPSA